MSIAGYLNHRSMVLQAFPIDSGPEPSKDPLPPPRFHDLHRLAGLSNIILATMPIMVAHYLHVAVGASLTLQEKEPPGPHFEKDKLP